MFTISARIPILFYIFNVTILVISLSTVAINIYEGIAIIYIEITLGPYLGLPVLIHIYTY